MHPFLNQHSANEHNDIGIQLFSPDPQSLNIRHFTDLQLSPEEKPIIKHGSQPPSHS